jgi:hypothetical protein
MAMALRTNRERQDSPSSLKMNVVMGSVSKAPSSVHNVFMVCQIQVLLSRTMTSWSSFTL